MRVRDARRPQDVRRRPPLLDDGAGKFTLIKGLAGMHQSDAGPITPLAARKCRSPRRKRRDAGLQVVYQDLALVDTLSVPTAALGVREGRAVEDLILRLRDEGRCLLVISHHSEQVMRISDPVYVMRQGRAIAELPTAEPTGIELASLVTGAHAIEERRPTGGNMNLLGLHTTVLTVGGDASATGYAAEIAARARYDLLELPILDPSTLDTDAARATTAEHGLQLAMSLWLSAENDVSSTSAAAVDAGTRLLHQAVDVTAAAGAGWMCGVLASALGKYPGPPTVEGRANAVAALTEVAAHAREVGVKLGLEVVNRYESNLINNTTDGLTFLDDVGSDQLMLHFDTYHALIEEESLDGAVRLAGKRLGYVHVGQNDRGDLTSGTVDLDGCLAAFEEIGFEGPITFEGFSRETADPALADTLAIWRSRWTDGEKLAVDALAFLRDRLGTRSVA
jgi:D-psicose/D-tagatose/L-ribulose 3-epimerase